MEVVADTVYSSGGLLKLVKQIVLVSLLDFFQYDMYHMQLPGCSFRSPYGRVSDQVYPEPRSLSGRAGGVSDRDGKRRQGDGVPDEAARRDRAERLPTELG